MTFFLRDERPDDLPAIRRLVAAAFADMPYSRQTEVAVLDGLRAAGALTVSLVAVEDGEPIGQLAFSPVGFPGGDAGWFGGGPLSVRPDRQRRGVGSALMREGLARLRALGGRGCVLVGEPAYYRRFGFTAEGAPDLPGVSPEFVLALALAGRVPAGSVRFHPAFATGAAAGEAAPREA